MDRKAKERFWCNWAEQALGNTLRGESKITENELAILANGPGVAGTKGRRLLNNLGRLDGAKYLEVGLWRGSTFFAALYGNNLNAFGVDNWSQNFHVPGFDGRKEFFERLGKYRGDNNVTVIERDIFDAETIAGIGPDVDIYFYDGEHGEDSQYRAFVQLKDIFADVFIALVDDYALKEDVPRGTERALAELEYKILMDVRLGIGYTEPADFENWWNGYRLLVLSK